MQPFNIRLPSALIDALRAQAEAHNLPLAAHVRSQLIATLTKPHNVIREVSR